MKMSKAFVAGATGFTGRAVVEVLRARGIETIAHVRPESTRLERWREELAAIGARLDTTPWRDEEIAETIRTNAPDVIFALLGTTRSRARAEGLSASEGYEKVDYGLSVMLLRAAEACERPPRLVYLSSLGAESGRGLYMAARKRVEERLLESRVPWIIARPSIITGARVEPRPAERAAGVIVDGCLGVLGALGARRLRDRYRSTSDRALAERLVELALDPEATGTIYEGAGLEAAS